MHASWNLDTFRTFFFPLYSMSLMFVTILSDGWALFLVHNATTVVAMGATALFLMFAEGVGCSKWVGVLYVWREELPSNWPPSLWLSCYALCHWRRKSWHILQQSPYFYGLWKPLAHFAYLFPITPSVFCISAMIFNDKYGSACGWATGCRY